MCLHVYVRPATIESFKALNLQGAWRDDNKDARHSLSPDVSHFASLRLNGRSRYGKLNVSNIARRPREQHDA